MDRKIRVGDTVVYRKSFGFGPKREGVVRSIQLSESPDSAYGKDVDEIQLFQLDRATFVFEDGYWAYGDQIIPFEDAI